MRSRVTSTREVLDESQGARRRPIECLLGRDVAGGHNVGQTSPPLLNGGDETAGAIHTPAPVATKGRAEILRHHKSAPGSPRQDSNLRHRHRRAIWFVQAVRPVRSSESELGPESSRSATVFRVALI
jgi:hypothetical protein